MKKWNYTVAEGALYGFIAAGQIWVPLLESDKELSVRTIRPPR